MNIKYTKNNKYSTQKILKLVHTKSFLFLIEYCPSSTCHIIFISILKRWSAIFLANVKVSVCDRRFRQLSDFRKFVGFEQKSGNTKGNRKQAAKPSNGRGAHLREILASSADLSVLYSWHDERCSLLPNQLLVTCFWKLVPKEVSDACFYQILCMVSQVLHTDCTINRKFPWHLW